MRLTTKATGQLKTDSKTGKEFMHRMLRYIVTASTVGMFACSNVAPIQGWGPASLRLQEGMTEKEAIQAVGYTPSLDFHA